MRNIFLAVALSGALGVSAHAQQQCVQRPYGEVCGPTLTVSFSFIANANHHKISVLMQNGFPRAHGLWIWGIQELAWPIPGSDCKLYTDFVYGHPFLSEANGSRLMEHSWPLSMNGAYVRLQAASLAFDAQNNLIIKTTNGVFAQCQ